MADVDIAATWTVDAELAVAAGTVSTIGATWLVQSAGTAALTRDLVIPPDGAGRGKRVVVVDKDGGPIGTLARATKIQTTHQLNEWDTYQFQLQADDPQLALVADERLREVQIWWQDVLLVWGPMSRPDISGESATIRGVGAPWYLSRRHVGKASRDNELNNPSFEGGLTGWNVNKTAFFLDYSTVPAGEAASEFSVNAKHGTRVLKLATMMDEDPPGFGERSGDVFAWQEREVDGGEFGMDVTLVAWAWVDTILAGFDDWNTHRFGVLLARLPTDWRVDNAWVIFGANTWGGLRAFYTDVIEAQWEPLDERTPTNQWVRLETTITVPPNTTQSVIARLSGISGTVYYDRASLTYNTAFEAYQEDQTDIVCDLVDHAQDPAFDKNDVNLDCDGPATGKLRDLIALHAQHGKIWTLIKSFTQLHEGLDLGVTYTPTTRTLTTHFPHKGGYRPGLALATGRNVTDWRWTFDGEAATSSMILLGTGSGSDREEAAAIDDTRFPDGLILESVETVDADTPVEHLDELAAEALAVLGEPEVLSVSTYPNDPTNPACDFIGKLQVGDWLPVSLRSGLPGAYGFAVEADYRVTDMTITEANTLQLILNRRDVP